MTIHELKNGDDINSWLNDLENRGCDTIALDIEGEFNLHCYGEHLCLIQIFDGKDRIMIDPIKMKKPNIFRNIFEKRELLKIMYDSTSDASLLKNGYGIIVKSVLDLRPAVSLLEYEKQSLSAVLERVLSINPPNKKKFQMYNWMRRPIDLQALDYAMGDVIHLFELKDALFKSLNEKNLMEKYILRNLMVQNGEVKNNRVDRHKRAKGYRYLSREKKTIFKDMFNLRDDYAKKLNKPPDYVFRNKDLLSLCKEGITDPEFVDSGINSRIRADIRTEFSMAMKKAARMEGNR